MCIICIYVYIYTYMHIYIHIYTLVILSVFKHFIMTNNRCYEYSTKTPVDGQ